MSFCPSCGVQLDEGARFCANCGMPVNNTQPEYQQQNFQNSYQQPGFQQNQTPDVPNKGLKVLSFFIPLAGLILFILNQKEQPVSAKAYGKMALISFIISIVFYIIYFAVFGALMAKGVMDMEYSYYLFANLL